MKQFCQYCGSTNTVEVERVKVTGTYIYGLRCRDCLKNFVISRTPGNGFATFLEKSKNVVQSQSYKKEETTGERKTYPQDWPAYNEAQTNEKQLFADILTELMEMIEVEYRKRSGRPNNDFYDMIFSLLVKVYCGKSSRRTISELKLLQNNGYLEKIPHFNTLLNYFNDPAITPVLKKLIEYSALPLRGIEQDFTVDSSGFSTSLFSRWYSHKWGKEKDKRIWVKAHLMSGVKTNIVTSVEITKGVTNDTTQLPPLLESTSKNFKMRELSGDKAYSSKVNLQLVSDAGALPFIKFRKNSGKKRSKVTAWKKMFEYYITNHEDFLKHYHKRSNAESVFHMIKTKFGNNLKCKTYPGQHNELLCKILAHNICVLIQEMHELGIKVDFCANNYPAQKLVI